MVLRTLLLFSLTVTVLTLTGCKSSQPAPAYSGPPPIYTAPPGH